MGKQLVNFITCVISAISWRPVLVVEEAGVSERTTDMGKQLVNFYHLRLRESPTMGKQLVNFITCGSESSKNNRPWASNW